MPIGELPSLQGHTHAVDVFSFVVPKTKQQLSSCLASSKDGLNTPWKLMTKLLASSGPNPASADFNLNCSSFQGCQASPTILALHSAEPPRFFLADSQSPGNLEIPTIEFSHTKRLDDKKSCPIRKYFVQVGQIELRGSRFRNVLCSYALQSNPPRKVFHHPMFRDTGLSLVPSF